MDESKSSEKGGSLNIKKEGGKRLLVKNDGTIVFSFNNSNCYLPVKRGRCRTRLPRWYFNYHDNVCKQFNYSGCSGNNNNFKSETFCQSFCPPRQMFNNESRCDRIRERGDCSHNVIRFYYDNFNKVGIDTPPPVHNVYN